MNFKLNALVAAALLSAGSAHAAIDAGATGNGELFFNIWDANGSYTLDLNTTIDAFQTSLAAGGALNLSWAADSLLGTYLAGVTDLSAQKWNIVATDTSGAKRILNTYTAPVMSPTIANDLARTASLNVQTFATAVNGIIGANNSVAVNAASTAWAGAATFRDTINSKLNFSNAGTLANNTYATGLGFLRLDAAATGIAPSVYNPYLDGGVAVNAFLGVDYTLHLQAVPVPEASTYGMMLAGLGLVGFMARRRLAA
jgi:hypothetical protein